MTPPCTRTRFLDTRLRYAAWRSSYSSRSSLGVRYASFRAPALVVAFDEIGNGRAHVGEISKDPAVDGLLLERAIPALDDPVGFGLFNEGEAGVDAPVAGWLSL